MWWRVVPLGVTHSATESSWCLRRARSALVWRRRSTTNSSSARSVWNRTSVPSVSAVSTRSARSVSRVTWWQSARTRSTPTIGSSRARCAARGHSCQLAASRDFQTTSWSPASPRSLSASDRQGNNIHLYSP